MSLKVVFVIFVFFIVAKTYSQDNQEKKINITIQTYLARINDNIYLTKTENEKLFILKRNQTKNLKLVEDKYKNHFKLNDEILKVNIEFSKLVVQEFGKQKGLQILEASKIVMGTYLIKTKPNQSINNTLKTNRNHEKTNFSSSRMLINWIKCFGSK
jgi:DNA repair exonuclease SbcCD nuclease subunit